MSISVNEVATALTGALRLARFDADGMAYFDLTPAGFWRSFWAAALVAPFFFLLLLLRHMEADSAGAFVHDMSIELLAYAIAWLAFPVVMASLSRRLDCQQRYLPYIVAYNWCGAVQNAVYLPIAILGFTGALSAALANAMALAAILWVLAFSFFVARTVLGVSGTTAFGIVALDLVMGMVIDAMTNRFI